MIIFKCSFFKKVTAHLKSTVGYHIERLSEINTFKPLKTKISSIFLIRLRFLGYRCESSITIFAWWVT